MAMGYTDKIAKEVESLSTEQQAMVLNYVATLKSRKAQELLSNMSEAQLRKRDELAAFFSEFNADISNYCFDREEANARR